MTSYKLNRKFIILWQIRICVAVALLSGIVVYLLRFSLLFCLVALPVPFALVTAFWYIPVFAKRYSLEITDSSVTIKSGVFVKTVRVMPVLRTIYVTRYSTPVSRKFGLFALKLSAARGFVLTPELESEACDTVERAVKGEN